MKKPGKKILRQITANPEKYIFYGLLFASMFILYLSLRLLLWVEGHSWFFVLKSVFSDTSFAFLICLLFRNKWKIVVLFVPLIIYFLILANDLYFRNFGDLIPGVYYFSPRLDDEFVIRSTIATLTPNHMFRLIVALIPAIYALGGVGFRKFSRFNPDRFLIWGDIVLLILSCGLIYYSLVKGYYDYKGKLRFGEPISLAYEENWLGNKFNYDRMNFTNYLIKSGGRIYEMLTGKDKIELTSAQMEEIKNFLETNTKENKSILAESTSLENIILIVVESLPSKVIELDSLYRITPFIHSLINNEYTIYVNCKNLTESGGSSDAQFMYNTGLLPLKNEALVHHYAKNDYPSLAKAFQGQRIQIIGETTQTWNQDITYQSYGFSALYDRTAHGGYNQDSLIFEKSADKLKELKPPFYSFIGTTKMHDPFNNDHAPFKLLDWDKLPSKNSNDIEYFERTRRFDDALRSLILTLKKEGLYDKTLIVIAGDHPIRKEHVSELLWDDRVPLIILNSNRTKVADREYTQADVFPTILSIMNLDYNYQGIKYTGVGRSVFSDSIAPSTMPSDKAYEISSWLIRRKN